MHNMKIIHFVSFAYVAIYDVLLFLLYPGSEIKPTLTHLFKMEKKKIIVIFLYYFFAFNKKFDKRFVFKLDYLSNIFS